MKNTYNQKFISHLTILLLGSSLLYFNSNDEEKISSVWRIRTLILDTIRSEKNIL